MPFAYWAEFDSMCHKKGTECKEAKELFDKIDKKIEKLAEHVQNKNTTIIITADHGQIDTKEKNKIIHLDNHPELNKTLSMPLSGEPRVAYCYVKPKEIKKFENYIQTKLKKACHLYKSEDLIKKGYFGLYKPNTKLKDRIGDYVLIMKENYIIRDSVLGDSKKKHIGNHGGLSDEELYVPLFVIN